jgi:hypothetical protein
MSIQLREYQQQAVRLDRTKGNRHGLLIWQAISIALVR